MNQRSLSSSVCLAAVLLTTLARAESASTLFILDASGSMHAKVEGQPKIDVARKVMHEVVDALDPEVKLGLVAYGHRSKDDCKDIEVVAPVGTGRPALLKVVDGLQPKGKTPITDSIRLAASELKEKEGSASIVLVSDGKETCEGDPCAAAREAVAAGVHLRIHVVGFDVTPEEAEQLKCVAKEGKGKYVSASNAKELSRAIAEVAKPPTPAPTETPVPTAKPAPTEVPPTAAPQAQAPEPKQNILPRGGHGHADAVALAPGEYVMNWKLDKDVHEYWSVQAKPGQVVRAMLRPSQDRGYLGGVLYGPEKNDLVREGCTNRDSTLNWLTNAPRGTATYYLSIGGCNGVANGTSLLLSVDDAFDAGSGTDVGDDFNSAYDLSPGKYEGALVGHHGDDQKDFYRLKAVEAGKKIQIKLTPPTDSGFDATIYDQDRALVAQKRAPNAGAITRLSWSPQEAQEEVYLLVEPHHYPQGSAAVPYSFEVSVGP